MKRFFLRSGEDVIALAPGDFTIGRSSASSWALDDVMASRKHAVLRVADDRVVLEDLGSRNGTLLNGEAITAPIELQHGDWITIGALTVSLVEEGAVSRDTLPSPRPSSVPPGPARETTDTKAGSVFDILLAACMRSLGRGDLNEASTSATSLFLALRATALRGGRLSEETLRRATQCGLTIARTTKERVWVERIVAVHQSALHVLDDQSTLELEALLERLPQGSAAPLRGYIEVLKSASHPFKSDEHRRLDRLEAVLRSFPP